MEDISLFVVNLFDIYLAFRDSSVEREAVVMKYDRSMDKWYHFGQVGISEGEAQNISLSVDTSIGRPSSNSTKDIFMKDMVLFEYFFWK